MRIYAVRHGESMLNAEQWHQSADTPLSPTGVRQAEVLRERFTRIPVDVVLTSPHARAQQTAHLVNEALRKPLEVIERLRERKHPTDIEQLHHDDPHAVRIKELIRERAHDSSWRYADEENFSDLKNRAMDIIDYLERRQEASVLLITHGDILRMIAAVLCFGDQMEYRVFHAFGKFLTVHNTGITIFERSSGGRWKLITWNDHAHLG